MEQKWIKIEPFRVGYYPILVPRTKSCLPLVISRPVFRNQSYLARFQSANERRLLQPMRAKQAQALNKIGYEKRVQMLDKLNFLSFHTTVRQF